MSQLTDQRIRLAIDTGFMDTLNDVLTGSSPQFWNGVDLQFELGIFRNGVLADLSDIDSITVELKTSTDRTGIPLMSKTIASGALNEALTLDEWNEGDAADSHAIINFTNEEANLFLADDSVVFWLVISAITGDTPAHKLVLGATPLTVVEGGEGVTPPAFVATPQYYTAAQSDARYQLAIDLTSINNSITTLNTEMTAVTATANAALPKAGGTLSGALTITGLSGVLKATTGLIAGSATTSDLTEGSNLYFTNARADARITAQKNVASGLCPLDAGSLVPVANLPANAFGHVYVVSSQAAMLALSALQGDVSVRTDINQTFILSNNTPATLGNWVQLPSPASAVTSVNTFTGAVVLTTANISEVTNLYYTTARAQADALTAALTGFSAASGGTVTSGDSILSALGKFEFRCALNDAKLDGSNRVKLDGTTPMTGSLSFSGTSFAGVQLNVLTDAQRAALSAVNGMLIYNSSLSALQFYNGSWLTLANGASSTWYSGLGTPSGGVGQNGDYYIDGNLGAVYLKSGGSWNIVWQGTISFAGGAFTGPISFTGTGNSGVRVSNLTATQIATLTPGAGMVCYDTTNHGLTYYNATTAAWVPLLDNNTGSAYPAQVATASGTGGGSGTTTLFAVAASGIYRVSVYATVASGSTTGTWSPNIGWHDDDNAIISGSATLNTGTAGNFLTESFVVRALASTNLTYSTVITAGGSAAVKWFMTVERLA